MNHSMAVICMKLKMKTARGKFIHTINPLHVYCRLRNFGLNKYIAKFISCLYENIIFNFISKREASH